MIMQTNKHFVRKKQLEALYQNVPTIVLFGIFGTTVAAITLLFEFAMAPILLWVGYMYCVSFIRWIFYKKLKKQGYEKKGIKFWLNLFLMFSFFTGLGAGYLTYYYFDPQNLVYTMFVFIAYTGFLSAGILSNSVYMPAFFSYSLPPTVLVLSGLFSHYESIPITMAMMVLFYYIILIGFARKANDVFRKNAVWDYERDSLVRQLRQQKETAEQAIKAKSHFFASASHDLRQPLHALGLFHDALRYRINEPENLEIMDKISSSTQALNDLLHGMLDISKLDASVVENSPKHINLLESLSLVNYEFNARAREKNLELAFDIDKDINIYLDPALFERVVRNLVDNAVKYTRKGFIFVTAEEFDDYVLLKVEDSGIGIPKDQLENVFAEFNQLDNPERDKKKGLGLGLSIVRRLCKLMKVEISLKSKVGKGSLISLKLPLGEAVQHKEIEVFRTLTAGVSEILVVEDDLAVLDGMTLLLEAFGFKVSKSENAEDALRMCYSNCPDLIIADYRLPGEMDGLVLINAVRDHHQERIPAILVTGDTAPDRIKSVDNADVVVLHKPVEADVLENTINDALQSHF